VNDSNRRGFMLLEAIIAMTLITMMMRPLMSLILQMNRFVIVTMEEALQGQERLALRMSLDYEWLAAKRIVSSGDTLVVETVKGDFFEYGINGGRFFKRKQGSSRQYLTREGDIESVQFEEPYPGGLVVLIQTAGEGDLESTTTVVATKNGSILYVIVVLMGAWVLIVGSLISGLILYKKTLELRFKDRQSLSIALSSLALLEINSSLPNSFHEPISKSWIIENYLLFQELEISQNHLLYLAKTPKNYYVLSSVDSKYRTILRLGYSLSMDPVTHQETITITKIELL
jgi:hypothetical protein